MKVKQLDHLNFSVCSLEESIRWYAAMFGFEVVERNEEGELPWAILRSGDALLCLSEQAEWRRLPRSERREQGVHSVNHIGFRVVDRRAWEAVLSEMNPPLFYGSPLRYPNSTSWYVRDPSGYEIEVALWDHDQVAFPVDDRLSTGPLSVDEAVA